MNDDEHMKNKLASVVNQGQLQKVVVQPLLVSV